MSSPQKPADARPKAACAAWDSKPPSLQLLGDARFNHVRSSFFLSLFLNAEVRPALGWIRTVSGRRWFSVGPWILTSFTADAKGCEELQKEKGKSGRTNRWILSRETGFCHRISVSAEFWACHVSLLPIWWAAQFDTLGGPHLCLCTAPNLHQKSVRADLKHRQCLWL